MIGKTLLHYRVLDRLGQGGTGEVFLAEDLRLHRPVALKLLRQGTGCEDEERARLLREARAASALNHPNIAVVYDVGEAEIDGGRIFLLAMEYVPGKSLAELAADPLLSLDEILDLIAQAAEGLAEAHAHGIVHRDVKPGNLMVAQGRVKVLDFGLAQVRPPGRPDALTVSQEELAAGFAGTPHYMSPEQALGKPLDRATDVFSLGVVLYELIAGRRPFDGENFVQVADAVLHHDPFPLPSRSPGPDAAFPDPRGPEIGRLLSAMLAKDPAARPQDLREVAAALSRLRAAAPAGAASASPPIVAVAGFANITGHAEDEWLDTGLSETVTTALHEIAGLEVWGRERLREALRKLELPAGELRAEDAGELGRIAGARWIVAGGFQRLEDRVRVTARLIEVETGRILRSARADGRIGGIFELQDRIVAEVAAGLRGTAHPTAETEETQVVIAYEALAKGLLNMRADSYESLDRAILFFERALALDPDYVRAQIELGAALGQKADYLAAPEIREQAAALLRRVLERRPRLPRAWRELGMVLVAQGRVEEGLESMRRALALAPEDPRILGGLGRALFIGKADFAQAALAYGRAVERDPQAGWYWMQLAHCYALLRDFDRGEPAARRAIELQEAFLSGQQGVQLVGAWMRLGHLYTVQGRPADASEAFASEVRFLEGIDHALRSRIRVELSMRRGAAFLALGNREQAESAFAFGLDAFAHRVTLGADEPFTRYYAAGIHALRGEREEALDLLENAVAASPPFVIARARIEPEWDGVRDEPRFRRLVGEWEGGVEGGGEHGGRASSGGAGESADATAERARGGREADVLE